MTVFTDQQELQEELAAFVAAFVESEEGSEAVRQALSLAESLVLVLRTREPATVLSVDLGRGELTAAPAEEPGVWVDIHADDLHHLLMDHLGPVEISRLSETERLRVSGKPETLAALLLVAAHAQPHYPSSLARRGRTDLLGSPAPSTRTVWEVSGPPPPLIETRRPWQRPKPTTAARP